LTHDELTALISAKAHKALDAGITAFSADLAAAIQPPAPAGQHPTWLDGYVKRPPFMVPGVDYYVGVKPGAVLKDWTTLMGPGITVDTASVVPHVRVDATPNVSLADIDFSLHGGAQVFFIGCPNPTVWGCVFGGPKIMDSISLIFADSGSPGLTVVGCTIDGTGNRGSSLVSTAGPGVMRLRDNWLKNFSQHVLEMLVNGTVPYSIEYAGNLIEQGALTPGSHLNYLQIECAAPCDHIYVSGNTTYQTPQVSAGEGFQFPFTGGNAKNIILLSNVMIAKGTPAVAKSMSRMVHADGALNTPASAHDNYVDKTGAYGWAYVPTLTGWTLANNFDMTTGALLTATD
jgi:hypothetical protein